MSSGSGRSGVFLGYTPRSPEGTYRIGAKQKRHGTMVDSRHVTFQEEQVLPKFTDKTLKSHVSTDVDKLLEDQSPRKRKCGRRVTFQDEQVRPKLTDKARKTCAAPDADKLLEDQSPCKRKCTEKGEKCNTPSQSLVKVTKLRRRYRTQDLVDEVRVLTPGENFQPKNGNRAKYIADRLQTLLGLSPAQSTTLKYTTSKGKIKQYRYEDCKYDLNQGYLKLAARDSEVGRASVNVADWLTPRTGSLTNAVTGKLDVINQ